MRARRVLAQTVVRAAGGGAVAALGQQYRSQMHASSPTYAPRRRTTAKKAKPATPSKAAKRKAPATAAVVHEQRATCVIEDADADAPASVEAVDSSAPLPTSQSESKSDAPVEAEASPAPTAPQRSVSTTVSASAAPASSKVVDLLAVEREAMHRLMWRQRHFLIGAHAAMEATEECTDPRAAAPRLRLDSVAASSDAHQLNTSSVSVADRLRQDWATVFCAEPPSSSPAMPSHRSKAGTSALLPLEEATSVFANTFAFTLHIVQVHWRALAATTTAPGLHARSRDTSKSDTALPSSSTTATATAAGATSSLSFLTSPYAVSAAPQLPIRSPFSTATTLEQLAPLHWLETAFGELCQRVAREVWAEATSGAASAPTMTVASAAIRREAQALLAAVESEAICTGSPAVVAMRSHCRRKADAAAASAATTASSRKGRVALRTAAADTKVTDTLTNTVERVGLELHLVHVWLSQLCATTASTCGSLSHGEAVLHTAVKWAELCDESAGAAAVAAESSALSLEHLHWMLATALLEQLHIQPYSFHHSRPVVAALSSDAASGTASSGAKHTHTTEAQHLSGLAALLDFALTERTVAANRAPGQTSSSAVPSFEGTTTTRQDEALFVLLAAFHAVVPSYAVLFPVWQRLAPPPVLEQPPLQTTTATTAAASARKRRLQKAGKGSPSIAAGSTTEGSSAAASPVAVMHVLMECWTLQEYQVRQEGALAAVWWMRLLPLWVSTATGALQLQILTAAAAERGVSALGRDAGAGSLRALVQEDVADALDTLLTTCARLVEDALRFDRAEYERSRNAMRASVLSSSVGGPTAEGDPARRHEGDRKGALGNGEESTQHGEAEDGNNEGSDGAADADLPPLQRNRGKRSLFYKPEGPQEDAILQENHPHGSRSGGGGGSHTHRGGSRFVSRVVRAGQSSTSSSSGGLTSSSAAAVAAGTHRNTSALFDVLVMSPETPILLLHRFSFADGSSRRSPAVEQAWAATAHSKSELWRVLFALPSAAAVAGPHGRSAATENEPAAEAAEVQLLRGVLPAAVAALLPASVRTRTPHEEALALRRVLVALQRARELFTLAVFESLDHLLVAVARVLLRLQQTAAQLSANHHLESAAAAGEGKMRRRIKGASDLERAKQQLGAVLTMGATTLLGGNVLAWEGMQAAWQLRQLQQQHPSSVDGTAQLPTAAANAFAVQWMNATTHEMALAWSRCTKNPAAALANARAILTALQTPSITAALPPYARQVSMAALLQCLSALARYWRIRDDAAAAGALAQFHTDGFAHIDVLRHTDVLEVYQGLLDVLRGDADLRLLCCYAAFVDGLYEVHTRLKADHAALLAWADTCLLPLVLPVVVAGLRRSQATHNVATHADLCETTLMLLSPLSRFASNPQVGLAEVLRTQWNHVLLQVSLYCIRVAGRGGAKRAADYGMPPVALPDFTQHTASTSASPSLAHTARWWTDTFAHGAEPVFLRLLDRSNAILHSVNAYEPRDTDAATGVTAALAAYVTAWETQVRFGQRDWDALLSSMQTSAGGRENGSGFSNTSNAVPPATEALLEPLRALSAAVQVFRHATQPAFTACAEAAPFLASNPVKARQLGYLVRFMEHYLREQERLSRLSDDEMQGLLTNAATLPPAASLATTASAALSDTAPLVLLEFVGHLSSAGGWAMVTWSCNIAETVVKIELKRHRQLPEAVRVTARTTFLSQLRTVPAPPPDKALPATFLKALLSLADVVASTSTSLLGFYRRSPLQGLLCHPTRDQYRVLTFALKQATLYVQSESHRYRPWQEATATAARAAASDDNSGDGEAVDHEEEESPLPIGEDADAVPTPGTAIDSTLMKAQISRMKQKAGWHYASVWADYLSKTSSSSTTALSMSLSAKNPNQRYRFYVNCLVSLVDCCMESANLFLLRQQGDGEDDIRVVIGAAFNETCRTFAATIHSFLSLTRAQRRAAFRQEEAELLWGGLCAVAAISTVAPRDQNEKFFTPRCVQSIHHLFGMVRRLVEEAQAADDAAAGTGNNARPVTTALVHGLQLLLRDPRAMLRQATRLGMADRERDDLTAMLTAFHVLLTSASHYEPGRALMQAVWACVSVELMQPLLTASSSSSRSKAKKAVVVPTTATLDMAATTVASSKEYSAVLRDLAATCAEAFQAAPVSPLQLAEGNAENAPQRTAKAAASHASNALIALDTSKALQCIVQDAAAIQREHERGLREALAAIGHGGGASRGDAEGSSSGSAVFSSGFATSPATAPHLSIAEAIEEGTMPLSEILDAAIAHAKATIRGAGGRSAFDNAATASAMSAVADAAYADDPDGAVGFARLIREYCTDMLDLLRRVSLQEIVSHPQAEELFGGLNLLEGCVPQEMENELWSLLAAKWKAELVTPSETTFLALQQAQLTRLRATRALHRAAAATSHESNNSGSDGASRGAPRLRRGALAGAASADAALPDLFSRGDADDAKRTANTASARDGAAAANATTSATQLSVSAAAQASMRDHSYPEPFEMTLHDDGRRVLMAHARGRGSRSTATTPESEARQRAVELEADATGIAALRAMPPPVPISVLLSLLRALKRHSDGGAPSAAGSTFRRGLFAQADASWIAAGGGSAGRASRASPFAEFVDVVMTYTARTYWLLRPRLEDNALLAWAALERSMAVFPAENGVRQREWERMCRQWRLPTSTDHATAAAGQLFTEAERRRIAAWMDELRDAPTAAAAAAPASSSEVAEEVAVYSYIRGLALYMHLLTTAMALMTRHRLFGDLTEASPDVVRRRLQLQVTLQRRNNADSGGTSSSVGAASTRERVVEALQALALERHTVPELVNRNLLESAALHMLNVAWCMLRHADSLTHLATDTVLSGLVAWDGSSGTTGRQRSTPSAVTAYADDVRMMVVSVLQDTFEAALSQRIRPPVLLTENVMLTLLASGFSCDPLLLPTSQSDRHGGSAAETAAPDRQARKLAPAVSVIATLLNTSAIHAPAPAAASASAMASAASALNPVARAELYVGSPALLAMLSPQFVKASVCAALQGLPLAVTLLPVVSALEFYLSRRGVPLSPLLEATTELLTASHMRNSAVHTYCERLAVELTRRKEFRQALAPPTIASVEQGAAGTVSNEVVISFLAAIARRDVHVTKKTVAHLLHAVMTMRLDVFGQPPTANRQGKLTLVQVGTAVDAAMDTTNPLYTPKQQQPLPGRKGGSPKDAVTTASTRERMDNDADELDGLVEDDGAAAMKSFSLDRWTDATAMTHRKALAALTIALPTVMEVAMHMDAMRSPDYAEWQRATQMLKAADDARRERVAMHRSQAQVAAVRSERSSTGESTDPSHKGTADALAAAAGPLDAALHVEDPLDFGVALLHLRYALRKIVHASLRRLLHQQGPRMLAEVATMLALTDPGLRSAVEAQKSNGASSHPSASGAVDGAGGGGGGQRLRPYDGIVAGTTRVLLSRAVLCAQAIGYDSTGAALELGGDGTHHSGGGRAAPANGDGDSTPQPVLKLPVPALQASAVEAAMSAAGSALKGRHTLVGHSSGKIGALTKEEKAAVHQRVALEREAAMTVGLTTTGVPASAQKRLLRALRYARMQARLQRQRAAFNQKRRGSGGSGSSGGYGGAWTPRERTSSPSGATSSPSSRLSLSRTQSSRR